MSERCFTPATARQTLTTLRPAAESLCRLYREMERSRPPRILPDQPVRRDYFVLVLRLLTTWMDIHRRGARVRDLRSGALGFPARRAGKPVWLCWKVGEPSLGFWHDRGTGPGRRRPVDEDGPWEDA